MYIRITQTVFHLLNLSNHYFLVEKIKSRGSTPPEGMISAENSDDDEYDEQLAQVNS